MQAKDQAELRESIRILERKLGVLTENEFSCCGVSFAQCHALVEIGRAGTISLNALAQILGLDTSTLSRTVNGLADRKLALRETDPDDRRYIKICLTGEGTALFTQIEENMQQYYKSILDHIPKDKQAQVIESLHLLAKAFENCCKE